MKTSILMCNHGARGIESLYIHGKRHNPNEMIKNRIEPEMLLNIERNVMLINLLESFL